MKKWVLLFSSIFLTKVALGAGWDWTNYKGLLNQSEQVVFSNCGEPNDVMFQGSTYVSMQKDGVPKEHLFEYKKVFFPGALSQEIVDTKPILINGPIQLSNNIMTVLFYVGFEKGMVSFYKYRYTVIGNPNVQEPVIVNLLKSKLGDVVTRKDFGPGNSIHTYDYKNGFVLQVFPAQGVTFEVELSQYGIRKH